MVLPPFLPCSLPTDPDIMHPSTDPRTPEPGDPASADPDDPEESNHLPATVVGIGVLLLGVLLASAWALNPKAPCTTDGADCPRVEVLAEGGLLDEAYHIYDRSGEPLRMVGGTRRAWVSLESLPALIPEAWMAVEDRRFRAHGGVDIRGAVRAATRNLAQGSIREGASTIPMQLTRVLWSEPVRAMGPWTRKLYEMRMARRLVDELGHDRVLELYLNGIYLGEGIYGVGAASRHYFGVRAEELSLAQVATLVGLTKTPGRYNPRRHPERSLERRDVVLGILHREEIISEAQMDSARSSALSVTESRAVRYTRSYVSAAVRRELRERAPELAGTDGLKVYTTIHAGAQDHASRLMKEHLEGIENGEMGRYLGGDTPLQGGFIAMESGTGAVLALVGGRDFATTEFNRPLQSRRPVGSLSKPLILAASLDAGTSPIQALSTAPLRLETEDGTWSPRDHVDASFVLPRDMVVRSSNRAAVRLGEQVGVHRFAELSRRLGIRKDVPLYPSSFLGSFEASLSEITAAYAAFENGGRAVEPHLVERVEDASGRLLWTRPRPSWAPERVLSPEDAYLVMDALRGAVDDGTGWRVRHHVRGAAAGKTGTTNDGADAWFVGLRPNLAAGVWVGLDQPGRVAEGASGGRLAAPLWARWVAATDEEWVADAGAWTPPPGFTRLPISIREPPARRNGSLARGPEAREETPEGIVCVRPGAAEQLVARSAALDVSLCPSTPRRPRALEMIRPARPVPSTRNPGARPGGSPQ